MLTDPVSNFQYPDAWVDACHDREKLRQVESGLAVLTSSGQVLRRGFTTGTTAAAACKAAILSLEGEVSNVTVRLPCGLAVDVPVEGKGGMGECRKYSGDYPEDATAQALFRAYASVEGVGVQIVTGPGVGRYARDTPRFKKGEPAISEAALSCIFLSIREALDQIDSEDVVVWLEVVDGAAIGARTLNPKVGVEGGISVLGTTGLVEPWDDHLEESNLERIARADRVVLTTGRLGLRYSRMLFPDHEAVLVGARMEKALDTAKGEVVLCGLPALILKFIDPDVLQGTGKATVEELRSSPVWEERMGRAFARSRIHRPFLRVVLFDRNGTVIGDSG